MLQVDLVIFATKKGIILFGEKDNRISELTHKVPENIRFEMWKKLLMNTVFNSLGTICELGKAHGIPTPFSEFLGGLLEGTEFAQELREKA